MNLQQLTSFVRIAETHSFTGAADLQGMTQPAITQHVRALEKEFGQALFDRIGRSIQLTHAGEVLLGYARQITELATECRFAMQDLQDAGRGRLRLGAGLTISVFVLPGLLRQYRRQLPGVDLTVSTGSTKQVVDLVLANAVDLALVTEPGKNENLLVTNLYGDEMVLVVHPGHHFCRQRQIAPEALRGESFIFFEPGSGYRTYLEEVFRKAGVWPRITMDLDSVEAMVRMAEIGLGVTILPRLSATEEISRGSLVPIKIRDWPPLVRTTAVVHRKDKYVSSAMRAFLTTLERSYGVEIPISKRNQ